MPARGKHGKPKPGFPPFPPPLEIPQERRDSHIPTASTTTYMYCQPRPDGLAENRQQRGWAKLNCRSGPNSVAKRIGLERPGAPRRRTEVGPPSPLDQATPRGRAQETPGRRLRRQRSAAETPRKPRRPPSRARRSPRERRKPRKPSRAPRETPHKFLGKSGGLVGN